jgi:hypothetical protein
MVHGEVTARSAARADGKKTIDLEVECKQRGERSPPEMNFRSTPKKLSAGRNLEALRRRTRECALRSRRTAGGV